MQSTAPRQEKRFAARAKSVLLIEGLTIGELAGELKRHRASVSSAINHGASVCPVVHREVATRLKIKPLI